MISLKIYKKNDVNDLVVKFQYIIQIHRMTYYRINEYRCIDISSRKSVEFQSIIPIQDRL